MKEFIQDEGKVWLRGRPRPVYAVIVKDRVVIPGVEEGDRYEMELEDSRLKIDIDQPALRKRLARYFPLEAEGDAPGTLFNGFNQTRHADILALTPQSPGVMQWEVSGKDYEELQNLDSEAFWRMGLEKLKGGGG